MRRAVLAGLHDGTFGEDDVGHVALALPREFRFEHGVARPRDHAARVVQVQQRQPGAVDVRGVGGVVDHEPAVGRLDGRRPHPDLLELPRTRGTEHDVIVQLGEVALPEGIAGRQKLLLVLEEDDLHVGRDAVEHGDPPADEARKQRGVFVANGRPDAPVPLHCLPVLRGGEPDPDAEGRRGGRLGERRVRDPPAVAEARHAGVLAAPPVGLRRGREERLWREREGAVGLSRGEPERRDVAVEPEGRLVGVGMLHLDSLVARRDATREKVDACPCLRPGPGRAPRRG